MQRRLPVPALLTLACLSLPAIASAQDQVNADQAQLNAKALLEANPALRYDPTSVLVRFRSDMSEAQRVDLRQMVGLGTRKRYTTVAGLELIDTRLDVELTIQLLEPYVEFAEPNWVQRKTQNPNDSYFSLQWGCNNTGQTIQGDVGIADKDIDAVEAWDIKTNASSFVVADIDTGVDWDHPDLAANIWSNPGEIAGNGQDDDGNGYVDDVRGWDFYGSDANPDDEDGHGSHTSGTVGAVGNNGTGVTGVAWSCKIVPLRFLGPQGGFTGDAISAVEYCTTKGIKASNNSWGGGGYSSALYSAINASKSVGHVFVAAAGNDGTNNDSTPHYPSNYNLDNIVSVAATDNRGGLANEGTWASNYGATSVDLAAPGVNIASTWSAGGYVWSSGTSMATPHVTGVVVLLYDQNPGWSYSQVISHLYATVTPNSNLSGKCTTGGDLNAFAALNGGGGGGGDTTPPATPSGLGATAGDATVSLDWANNGDSDLAGYRVYRSTTSGSGYSDISGLIGQSAYADNGASNGTTYYYVVTAEDTSQNESGISSEASATPQAAGGGGGGVEEQIFFGGFESGFAAGGWATNGSVKWSTGADQGGSYGARIKKSSWIEKSVSTSGYESITLNYARRTRNMDSGEVLTVEYWNGGAWVTLETTSSTSWGYPVWSLGADADDNGSLKLRFRTNANRNNERGDVDDVELRGTTL